MSFDFCIVTKQWPRVYVNYFGFVSLECVCELLATLGDGNGYLFLNFEFS